MRARTTVAALTLLMFQAIPAASQQPPVESSAPPARAEVLVLGVYHMANPGRDVFNTQADDVLSPRRQTEIVQVIEILKEFRPTKIAVEADFNDKSVPRNYTDYLAGRYELTRNETEQVGFRLAKELGHATIYPVDADGEFPFLHLVHYAKASDRSHELDALLDEVGGKVKTFDEYLASHTVLEALLSMNSDESVAEDVGYYYRQAEFGEHWDWAGADLVSAWFRRNMRIYSNIVQLVASPDERVLVIVGAGHLGWLQGPFGSNPNFRLRKLAELVDDQ